MQKDVEKLRYFLNQITPISEMYGNKAVLANIDKSIDMACQNTSVLFCGEFKRGKSSLINALLQDNLCPTDIGIATAVVTRILYGTTKKAVRYYGDMLNGNESLKTEEIAWDDISKYTVGDILDIDYTVQMDLYYPSEFLKDGIIIIDTPGIGGLDPRHGTLTKSALQTADIAIFITDACEPVTQSEEEFYKKHVLTNCPNNVVLVNKADELVSDVLNTHIFTTKKTLINENKAEVLPVSAMNWLLYNQFGTTDFKNNSHCDEVMHAIRSCVNSFRKQQLIKLRDAIIEEINYVLKHVEEEKSNLQANSANQDKIIENYQRQMAELITFKNDISNPTSSLRLKVNNLFEDAKNDVLNLLSHESVVLTSTTFDELIESEKGLSNDGKWIVAQINDKIHDLSNNINSHSREVCINMSNALNKELPGVLPVSFDKISDKLKIHNPFNSQQAFSLVTKLTPGSILGAIAGVGAEMLIPGIGLAVGIATAGALIWKRISHENEHQKKALIKQQLLPKINIALTDLRNQTITQFAKAHQGLLETLQIMITEAEERLKSLQESITKSRVSQKEHAELLSTIEQRKKFLTTLLNQCKLLYTNPFTRND